VVVTTEPALEPVPGLSGDRFLLTSDDQSLAALRTQDKALKARIRESVGTFTALWWQPVVASGTSAIGWHKTLGKSLPDA
jgi:hypothetical protein